MILFERAMQGKTNTKMNDTTTRLFELLLVYLLVSFQFCQDFGDGTTCL
jgi:hypothetical protein